MPKISVNVPHDLDPADALDRLKNFSDKFREQFRGQITKLEETWSDDSMAFSITARGLNIDGNVAVSPSSVDVVSSLPFAALPFRGMIESQIRSAISDALGA